MRWLEIINEDVGLSLLYHGTSPNSAIKIIRDNCIAANVDHTMYSGEPGVSLSRSFKVAHHFGDIIFALDKTKLAYNKKIKPVDYWGLSLEPEMIGSGRRQGKFAEQEEFVIGSIKPLDRYLVRIDISGRKYNYLKGMMNYDREMHAWMTEILDHPLLHVNGVPLKS